MALGWALQIALIASGVFVPIMFMGAVFAALWWASVHFGRKVDEAKARSRPGRSPPPRLTLRNRGSDTPCNLVPPAHP